ncbi:hypothetical protein COS55_03030 [Candidatus Shapirobacteria bacterium CG03_land_8_20_14_0_80_40_19]|uniref:Type II secretion system protein GspG C-terminal domain-containing protein n=2 Tax=Candidatus Shapironibacteriota TaxID=1752721 RepID=A0A2M7BCE4_9BACT|nr:MAG: hypothetical protein COS55_03030 [Candidatus Shapirobacteria bacterium CG03_land_8_20_14_0_80_40_19]PJC28913.1 MAG: hypothetical protein CO053_02115 [Candidatus Shapirobacteria bacterium CG_4_9_14_0_2_um_filter_40_11]
MLFVRNKFIYKGEKMKKLTKGFTLIELLVVISIIGILASLALTSYGGAQKQARDTQRRSDLGQYRNGLEAYAASNNGLYPVHAAAYDTSGFCGGGVLSSYLSSCPPDPITTNTYYYISDAGGTKFILYANLETDYYWYVCSTGKSDKTVTDTAPNIATCP